MLYLKLVILMACIFSTKLLFEKPHMGQAESRGVLQSEIPYHPKKKITGKGWSSVIEYLPSACIKRKYFFLTSNVKYGGTCL